jgi:hypothetical protein
MTDNKNDETDVPWASGLDDLWWRTNSGSTTVDKEKGAEERAEFQQFRTLRYIMSERREQHGGCAAPTLMGGKLIDWRRM